MEATVNDIIKVMDGIAPPNLAEPWDNVGLLVGRSSNTVKKLMVALDVSPEVVEQAVEHKVQMLVTHHPVIFDPIKKMTDRSWQHKLLLDCAENKIAVYSAHTSLDSVLGGVNDVLAEKIGLLHTEVLVPAAGGEAGLGRVGCLHEPMTLQEFSEKIKTVLKLDNIIAGDAGRRVSKVAVCGGAGAGVHRKYPHSRGQSRAHPERQGERGGPGPPAGPSAGGYRHPYRVQQRSALEPGGPGPGRRVQAGHQRAGGLRTGRLPHRLARHRHQG